MALHLQKRSPTDQLLSDKWLTRFLNRHPELKTKKPKSLSILRAKAVTKESLTSYYDELEKILTDNNLLDKPERIFNIDETGLSPEHNPRKVIAAASEDVPGITSPRSSTTTLIA
jgi:hypothetical protein